MTAKKTLFYRFVGVGDDEVFGPFNSVKAALDHAKLEDNYGDPGAAVVTVEVGQKQKAEKFKEDVLGGEEWRDLAYVTYEAIIDYLDGCIASPIEKFSANENEARLDLQAVLKKFCRKHLTTIYDGLDPSRLTKHTVELAKPEPSAAKTMLQLEILEAALGSKASHDTKEAFRALKHALRKQRG